MEHKFEDKGKKFVSAPEIDGCESCAFSQEFKACERATSFIGCIGEKIIWVEDKSSDIPTKEQVGGKHYKELIIQPVAYIHANNLSFLEGNVVKYVTRHKQKNGVEDIKKAIHYLNLILELEYSKVTE